MTAPQFQTELERELYEALSEALPILENRAPDFNETLNRIRAILAKARGAS